MSVRGATASPRRVTVLQSFPAPRPTTNPYLVQLLACATPEIQIVTFSWSRALLGRYDVVHLHWPEVLLRGNTRPRTWARRALFAALLTRLSVSGTPLVRTIHNLASHETGPWSERMLIAGAERRTTAWIRLNPTTVPPTSAPVFTIPHGDYSDWFSGLPVPPAESGRILYFGLIRPYKGVEQLLEAFGRTSDDALRLRVVGKPADDSLVARIRSSCTADARVDARLEYIDDPTLANEVGRAELVVLPFREMHNSGSLLLALSLARPVLVPANEVTAALAAEVGPGWVFTYVGDLTADDLTSTLKLIESGPRTGGPDLSRRTWDTIGQQHREVYRRVAGVEPTSPGRVTG